MRRGSWRLTDGRGRPSSREEPVEAAGAADAKSTRPPLLGKLQNSFPRASTGLLSSFGGDISIELRTGTFLTSLDMTHRSVLTHRTNRRKFDSSLVAINRHPSTSVHDHVEHASSSSPSGHSEKHPQRRNGW
jgi:hypothetical protein